MVKSKKVTKAEKRGRIAYAKKHAEIVGGRLVRVNWKRNKRKAHFVSNTGMKFIIGL